MLSKLNSQLLSDERPDSATNWNGFIAPGQIFADFFFKTEARNNRVAVLMWMSRATKKYEWVGGAVTL